MEIVQVVILHHLSQTHKQMIFFPPQAIIISANNDFIKMKADKFCKNAKDFNISVNHYIFAVDKFIGHDFTINYPHIKEGVYEIYKINEFINNLEQNKIQNGVFKFKQKIKR